MISDNFSFLLFIFYFVFSNLFHVGLMAKTLKLEDIFLHYDGTETKFQPLLKRLLALSISSMIHSWLA